MYRRDFLKNAAIGSAALFSGAGAVRAASGRPPNVLVFMVDQMRRPRWFPEDATLPNLDRLRRRGLEFTNHFCSAVPCSPSRACFMTGLHMDQNGVYDNLARNIQGSLDPAIPTIGDLFSNAGYRTPYFGKWHLTTGRDKKMFNGLSAYGFNMHGNEYMIGPMNGLRSDPEIVRNAINWLEEPAHHEKPWFLTVSIHNPHDIVSYPREKIPNFIVPNVIDDPPPNWCDDLEGKPRCQSEYRDAYGGAGMDPNNKKDWLHYINYYFWLNRRVDRLFGKVLDAVEKLGITENTIIIFTSDHGEMAGSHRLRSKGPCAYIENTNVPLVVSWPGLIPEGATTDALSQNVDIFPTIAGLLGIDAVKKFPYLPGKDLGPVLRNPDYGGGSDHVLFSYTNNIHLSKRIKRMGGTLFSGPHHIRAIRERDWVYARYFSPGSTEEEYELYDEANDPLEMRNLANDPACANKREEMADKLMLAEKTEMAKVDFPR